MAARYHINLETGEAGLCRAAKGQCPFGGETGSENHFGSIEEARTAYETVMKNNPIFNNSLNKTDILKKDFGDNVNSLTFEEIEKFTHQSNTNFLIADKIIRERGVYSVEYNTKLEKLDPNSNPKSLCKRDTFQRLRKAHNAYLDKTAEIIEASLSSKFFKPLYEERTYDSVGNAVKVHSYDVHSPEWYRTRFNTVGGSDVGVLAKVDFTPKDELKYWDTQGLSRVEKSKATLPTDEDIENAQKLSHTSKAGPLYRGTVAEDWIRNEFVKRHPELKVINAKDQFQNKDRDWQQVNFDGLYSTKGDSEKPDGVLEIKTGSSPKVWANGIPIGYRAQVLYCLHATGLKEAKVVAFLNNGDYREHTLKKDDPIVPGDESTTMDKYVKNRIHPWFENIRKNRPTE